MPATLTSTSTLPNCLSAASNRSTTEDSLETSQGIATAVPADFELSSPATTNAAAAFTSATTTRAPALTNSCATDLPMPAPPPVTTATLFCNPNSAAMLASVGGVMVGILGD